MRDCDAIITKVDCDWKEVKNECRNTMNKSVSDDEPTQEFKRKLLISEHSPIRLLRIKWRWGRMKSWCATHFARHWLGWDKWVGTRRSDRTGVDRGALSQNELVPIDVCANAQALINVARYRLCYQAASETREYMEDLKRRIYDAQPDIADVLVPNCVYRGGCSEFKECGFYQKFKNAHPDIDLTEIEPRYKAYNNDFFGEENAESTILKQSSLL